MFIDRHFELGSLEEAWSEKRAGLIILYGRRRVGKTELLRTFGQDRRQVFFAATQSSSSDQLRSFSAAVRRALGDEAAGVSLGSWEAAFEFLAARARDERLVVVLDEFPYLVQSEPSLPSLLQRAWDETLRSTRLLIVLCGSSISFMESELLGQKSPLYGRRTGQLLLQPLSYRDAALFFPGASPEERIELYAVLGGMPAYLLQFQPEESLWDNVRRRILRKGAFLHDEVPFLLMQELREPRLYLALLTAMAEGRTRLGDIAERAFGSGQSTRAGFYMQTLQDLRLVERRVPITETMPQKSRKGIYVLSDPFVRFWMRYVFQEQSALEAGLIDQVLEDRILPSWNDFVAPVFEEACRQFVRLPPAAVKLPFVPGTVGAWWSAGGEIDVVALDRQQRRLLCGECKWSTRAVGTNVLDDLKARSDLLARELGVRDVHLAVFARRRFTQALVDRSRREGILLYSAAELYTDFRAALTVTQI